MRLVDRSLRPRSWPRRLLGPTAFLVAAQLVAAVMAPAAGATYQASVYANVTAFLTPCHSPDDTNPTKLYNLAVSGLGSLGYTAAGYKGSTFTKSKFLARVPADLATYVHTHGDVYDGVQGFRPDAALCSASAVHATDIKSARNTTRVAQLVIMSTCHLGEAPPGTTVGMSAAFGIPYNNQSLAAYAFYLAYKYTAWDSQQFTFEQLFWQKVQAGVSAGSLFSLKAAYTYAKANTLFTKATDGTTAVPVWFGNAYYTGWADTSPSCTKCQ